MTMAAFRLRRLILTLTSLGIPWGCALASNSYELLLGIEEYMEKMPLSYREYQKALQAQDWPVGLQVSNPVPAPDGSVEGFARHRNLRGSARPRQIVIHNTEGSFTVTQHVFAVMAKPVSAHVVLNRDGSVLPMVLERDRANHAGDSRVNLDSLGIEVVAYPKQANTSGEAIGITPSQHIALGRLVRHWLDKYGMSAHSNLLLDNYRDVKTSASLSAEWSEEGLAERLFSCRDAEKLVACTLHLTVDGVQVMLSSSGQGSSRQVFVAEQTVRDVAVAPERDRILVLEGERKVSLVRLRDGVVLAHWQARQPLASVGFDAADIVAVTQVRPDLLEHWDPLTGAVRYREKNPHHLTRAERHRLLAELAERYEFSSRQLLLLGMPEQIRPKCGVSPARCLEELTGVDSLDAALQAKTDEAVKDYLAALARSLGVPSLTLEEIGGADFRAIAERIETRLAAEITNFDLLERTAPVVVHMEVRAGSRNTYYGTHVNSTDCPVYLWSDSRSDLPRAQTTRREFFRWRRQLLRNWLETPAASQ